jgi:hypothetical protein
MMFRARSSQSPKGIENHEFFFKNISHKQQASSNRQQAAGDKHQASSDKRQASQPSATGGRVGP